MPNFIRQHGEKFMRDVKAKLRRNIIQLRPSGEGDDQDMDVE